MVSLTRLRGSDHLSHITIGNLNTERKLLSIPELCEPNIMGWGMHAHEERKNPTKCSLFTQLCDHWGPVITLVS